MADVERVAAGLRGLGIGKGDRLTIYMPTTAEAITAMLATVRIGAIHSVVFAGFGAGALGERVDFGLVDRHPVRNAEFAASFRLVVRYR